MPTELQQPARSVSPHLDMKHIEGPMLSIQPRRISLFKICLIKDSMKNKTNVALVYEDATATFSWKVAYQHNTFERVIKVFF